MSIAHKHKLDLVCEECGQIFVDLEIVDLLLYCQYCLEVKERRETLLREESEWSEFYNKKE